MCYQSGRGWIITRNGHCLHCCYIVVESRLKRSLECRYGTSRFIANPTADSEGAAPSSQPLPVRLQPQFVPLFVTGLPVRDNTPNLLPPLFFATPDTQTFIYSHFYSGQEILGGGEVPLNLVLVTSQVSQVRHLNRGEETEQGCCP